MWLQLNLILLYGLLSLALSACSLTPEAPDWRVKSIQAFDQYQELYLANDTELASIAFKQSVFYAKKSADFSILAGVYLGECALHRAVLLADDCQSYQSISKLTHAHQAYYAFLQGRLPSDQIKQLPTNYQPFAHFWIEGQSDKAQQALLAMDKLSSQLIAASLMHQQLSTDTVRTLIDRASKKGYQKAVIAWLNYLYEISNSPTEKNRIKQKLQVMQSPAI